MVSPSSLLEMFTAMITVLCILLFLVIRSPTKFIFGRRADGVKKYFDSISNLYETYLIHSCL